MEWLKVRVYESFTDGAKEGFQTAVRIIPFLVAMLAAIGAFRAFGAMDLLTNAFKSYYFKDWNARRSITNGLYETPYQVVELKVYYGRVDKILMDQRVFNW